MRLVVIAGQMHTLGFLAPRAYGGDTGCNQGETVLNGPGFDIACGQFRGPRIVRPGYDLQPTVLYDPDDAPRTFKMWWLGQYNPSDMDLAPLDFQVGDRVYYSFSTNNGETWSAPQVVLKGRGGSAGSDAADDHLVGSPTVLKINGKYYMFYEAYGKWVTTITRFFSASRGDTWVHNGLSPNCSADWVPCPPDDLTQCYQLDAVKSYLGFAPAFKKHNTHPLYAGEVTYSNGKKNRFLQQTPVVDRVDAQGSWRSLNNGVPVFELYNGSGNGTRKKIYSCFDGANSNTFATDDANCEGHGVLVEELGFAIANENSPDMANANQNRICLATSTDGIHWTRFQGASAGGAVIAPQQAFTNTLSHGCGSSTTACDVVPNETFDVHRAYGSGFPVALERDGTLELYFTDDTNPAISPLPACSRPPVAWRIRIPVDEIENPQAYVNAAREYADGAGVPGDMKWSPMHQRYFATTFESNGLALCDPNFVQKPKLAWSGRNPDPTVHPLGGLTRSFDVPLPSEDSIGVVGGLLGDGLGHTVDFVGLPFAYTAFHLFYEAIPTMPTNQCGNPLGGRDLHHLLVFGYPLDADIDGYPDTIDVCPNDPLKTISAGACGCGFLEAFHPFDIAQNCTVDLPDAKLLVGCLSGPGGGTSGCGGFNVDGDSDVDLRDAAEFQRVFGRHGP